MSLWQLGRQVWPYLRGLDAPNLGDGLEGLEVSHRPGLLANQLVIRDRLP